MSELLTAINNLQQRMDKRFDRVDKKFDALDERVNKVERDIFGVKTIGSLVTGVAGFFGWDYLKLWLGQK